MIWCSNPKCDKAIERPIGVKARKVTCTHCNQDSCFLCQTPWHEGRRCRNTKNKKASKALRDPLCLANVRKCPRCSTFIIKSDGCLHVLCPRCQLAFCWSCMGALASHSVCYKLCPELPFSMLTNILITVFVLILLPLLLSVGPLSYTLYMALCQGVPNLFRYYYYTKKWYCFGAFLWTLFLTLIGIIPLSILGGALASALITLIGLLPGLFWTISYLLRISYHYGRILFCA